jgi:hypothetical protein
MAEEENEKLKSQIYSLNFEIGSLKKQFQQETEKLLSDFQNETTLR